MWKFFERVEAVLNEDTKLEMSIWLKGVCAAEKTQGWPETFVKVFDRLFGKKHWSIRCFGRSCIASLVTFAVMIIIVGSLAGLEPLSMYSRMQPGLRSAGPLVAVLIDYIALLSTRLILSRMILTIRPFIWALWMAADASVTVFLGYVAMASWAPVVVIGLDNDRREAFKVASELFAYYVIHPIWTIPPLRFGIFQSGLFYSTLFTSTWLYLYAGSGLLLKAARRFDIGFQWFNRHADIEKKPLQSIGLVAGALVSLVYWAAVLAMRIL